MCTEVLEFKKCCWCVPLRYGLIAWGYIKLIGYLLLMSYLLMAIVFLVYYRELETVSYIVVGVILLLVEIAFCVTFIVAVHKKRAMLLRICYRYCIISVVVATIILTSLFRYSRNGLFLDWEWILYGVSVLVYVVLQIYIILLTRSEIHKLLENYDFRFVNNTADAECILQENAVKKNDP